MQKDQMNQNIKNIHSKQSTQSKQNSQHLRDLIEGVYDKYYAHIQFNDIDYLIGQPPQGMLIQNNEVYSDLMVISDGCLIIKQKGFDKLYGELMMAVVNTNQNWSYRNKCSDILMTLNGENDKVYNLKKQSITNIQKCLANNKGKVEEMDMGNMIDLNRELVLNSAVIMKFKKTSSCYEYRMRLVETLFKMEQKNVANFAQFLKQFHKNEHMLMKRILDRFYRNYFCWMYRLRLFKLILKFQQTELTYLTEFRYVYQFLQKNPNDYSCYSYVMFLLRGLGIKHKSNGDKEKESKEKGTEIEKSKCMQQISQKIKGLQQFYKLAYEDNTKYKYLSLLHQYMQSSK